MQILMTMISALGAVLVFGFLVRNLLRRSRVIAEAKFPDFVRASYNMSTAITMFCIVAWGSAAFLTADYQTWSAIMMSPLLFGFVLGLNVNRFMKRQNPEVRAYAEELAQNSPARKFARRRGL